MNQTRNTAAIHAADTFGAVDFMAEAHVLRAQAAADMADAAGAALRRLAGRIGDRFAAAVQRRATCRELLRLDDRMLADIGLTRFDVEAYAAGDLGITSIVPAEDGPLAKSATVVDFAARTPGERLGVALARCGAHRTAEAA
jgi:uncharacterized protein YjiS (DUF1127 family)